MAQNILCTANLQHRCEVHKCDTSGIEYIYEECQQTSKTKPAVHHIGNVNDLVLNTAQMHDSKHFHHLQILGEPLNMDNSILEGAAEEINLQKTQTTLVNNTATCTTSSQHHGRGT
jgi:hypothetical protein